MIGAALALRDLCKDQPYKIVIYGTPAEETVGGKIIMKEKGCFQDIDLALMMHAAPIPVLMSAVWHLSAFTLPSMG